MKEYCSFLQFAMMRAIFKGSHYGLQIRAVIGECFGREVSLGGTYTVLHAMEREGWVKSAWSNEQSGGGRRRYYVLTMKGTKICKEMKKIIAKVSR